MRIGWRRVPLLFLVENRKERRPIELGVPVTGENEDKNGITSVEMLRKTRGLGKR